jgi:hypothetical protein
MLSAETEVMGELAMSAPKITCSVCGASYPDEQWRRLRLFDRIDEREVRRLVLNWPESLCVEVRFCGGCGHTMAAKRQSESSPPIRVVAAKGSS